MASKQTAPQTFIYGIHPIIELILAKRRQLRTIYTTNPTPKAWDQIKKILPERTQIQYVSRDQLTKMVDTPDHQGVVATVGLFPIRKKFFDPARSPFLVMLDGVQDPRNLGAIIRSAYCTGADGIILCGKNGAPLNAVAIKSSAGLSEHMEIYEATSASAAMIDLKKAGYKPYLAVFNGKDARTVDFAGPVCLVIGGEGAGISSSILNAGEKVTLPQKQADVSYNASVAAGILLFMVSSLHKKI